MTLLERARKLFGLQETATEEEVAAKLEAAVPPADMKPEQAAQDETGKQELSRQPAAEVIALRQRLDTQEAELKQFREAAEAAQQALAREKASQAVEAFVSTGKILPAQREDALAFALRDFDSFQKLFTAARPQLDTRQYGGLRPEGSGGESGAAEGYLAEVGKVLGQNPKMEYDQAATQVAADRPDLYERYRKEGK